MVWGLQRSKYITLVTMADFILFCGGKKLRCVSNQEKLHPECVTGSVILDQEGSWFKGKDGHVIQIHGTNIYQKCWHIISSVPSASNQSAFFYARQFSLSRCTMGKPLPWHWQKWNNEMTSPESWNEPNWELVGFSLRTKLWPRKPPQLSNSEKIWEERKKTILQIYWGNYKK